MKLRALHVDDDPTDHLSWGRPLETRFGWHVDYVTSVTAALELLKQAARPYDAAILDRSMPDPNRGGREQESAGDDLLREIVIRYPYCCVVMFTNVATVADAQRNARRGAYAFLEKHNVEDLDQALRNGVAAKRVERLYDRVLLTNYEQPLVRVVEELAEILRVLHRPGGGPIDDPARVHAFFLPISPGGSPKFPVGENLESRFGFLPRDPAGWREILADQRVVENSGRDLDGQWTASRDFTVRHQVFVPVRAEKLAPSGDHTERGVVGAICLESNRTDVLLEEQIDVTERVARAMGLMIDARRQAEDALAEGERSAQRDLQAEFAHRVRNPLQTAQLTLESLIGQLDIESMSTQVRERLRRLGDSLRNAIEASLSFKDKSQPGERQPREIDLGKLLMDVVADLPEDKRDAVHLDARTPVPPILGDPSDLKYALRCILDNSLDAIERAKELNADAGHVAVALEHDPTGSRDARITIVDDGCGFAADTINRVFDRGFSTRQGEGGHAGLGLWEVKRIMHEHGGEVEAAAAPKGGAYVSLLLPLKSVPDRTSESVADA